MSEMVRINQIGLLENAEIEEKNYNWSNAVNLYEQVAKFYLDNKMLNDAANLYNKIGELCFRALLASRTKEEYLNWNEHNIKVYYKAEDLYKQIDKELLSLECKVKALHIKGWAVTSIEEGKAALKDSINICLDLNKRYTNKKDKKNLVNSNILILRSIIALLVLCKEPSEFNYYMQLSRNLIEEVWPLIEEYGDINSRSYLIYLETIFVAWNRYTELTFGDKREEDIRKKLLMRCEECLDLFENYDDFYNLGRVYLSAGINYGMFGTLYAEEPKKRMEFVEKTFDFLEKAITFLRVSGNKIDLIDAIYVTNYLAGVFGRFEYYQKRILRDVREIQKFDEIYDGFYTFHGLLISRTSIMYYHNFVGRSFLKRDTRISYAKLGIKYARKQLEKLAFGPFFALTYQLLTQLFSNLVILATEDDLQEEYIQEMFYYAKQAENAGKGYKGGTVRSAGLDSIYRANKTMADIVKNKQERIEYLKIAIEALKNNTKYAIESYNLFLATQIRLSLLYEELGILMVEEKPLMEARKLFLRVIEDASEKGYEYYAAACYEYIARLEDRLGNHNISAEFYDKAQEAHKRSLKKIDYKFLKEKINEKINYAKAWKLIEEAKTYHKREDHIKAKERYERATEVLKILPNFNYEAIYYNAWKFLEEAEDLSKREKCVEAIKSFEKTRDLFDNAIYAIRFIRKNVRRSKELKKLEKVAKVRMNHCSARINLDEARILGKRGEHIAAAEKFKNAASQFRDTCLLYKIKKERIELEAIYHLCRAWETMELAENYEDPEKFAEAATLFSKASDLFTASKLKFLAQGNSNFCLALEEGCRFDLSHDIKTKTSLFPKVKSILRKAAFSYEKSGFKSGAEWALATSTYFDAAWYLIQADEELDINKKQEFLSFGSNYLKASAELFHKAGYRDKEKEVLKRLERVNKEEKILISALNTINKPSVSRSIKGIVTPSCPIETSQSPRIGEIQQYSEEVSTFLERDRKTNKYEIEYRDFLKDYQKSPRNQCRVGIAQIGISNFDDIINEFYEEKPKGLLTLKEEKVREVESKVKEIIDKAYEESINILLFPEMTVDLKYKQFQEDISDLAKKYGMYIIPGSYHNIETKSNVSLVFGPEGILWQQEKHIPAIISLERGRFKEGIDTSTLPHKTIVCNTEFGRIVIVICRDFLDMDLRVELKNFEPPIDIILNPAFTPVTADFKAVHFDARRSIYAYTFFANIADYGNSLIYTPEKERVERIIPSKQEDLIYKDVDLFRLRSERKKWEKEQKKEIQFIQSTR
jgi:predicted amidohydrolase